MNELISFGSHPVSVGTKYMGLFFNQSVVASHKGSLARHEGMQGIQGRAWLH